MKRRMHGVLVSAVAVFMGAGALLSGAASASATASASVTANTAAGTVTLTPRGSALTDGSPFTRIAVDTACPENYQDAVNVNLVVPDGRESSIAFHLTDGAPFRGARIAAQEPAASTDTTYVNSIADAFDNASVPVADGTYPIHVVCANNAPADFPQRPAFTGFIKVTGDTWHVADLPAPAVTRITVTASPAGHVQVGQPFTLTAKVSPAVAGSVQFTADNGINPIGTPVPVVNGVASVQAPANANPSVRSYDATFVPADQLASAQAYGLLSYAFVNAPAITVKDAAGATLGTNPQLAPGQRITVSATGFRPGTGEPVLVAVPNALALFPLAAPDASGSVADYPLTLPSHIADGAHTLTLFGLRTHLTITFAFTTKR